MKQLFSLLLLFFFLSGINAQQNKADKGDKSLPEMHEIFQIAEQMPVFPGCELKNTMRKRTECTEEKVIDYINANLKYPAKALKNRIEGRLILRFIVDKEGNIRNVKILRNMKQGFGFEEEATRLILSMNDLPQKWIPGEQGGRKINCYYTIPITFRLPPKDKSQ